MELEETMVEQEATEAVADDTLQEDLVEESDDSPSLESALEEEGQPAEEQPKETKKSEEPREPGWIKQRVDKAVQKAIAETEARMRAAFDAQMAPLRERMVEDEARELVRQGTVKDLDTAKELVRYRQGQQPAKKEEQPRNEKGQFAPKEDPVVTARIDLLAGQARKIHERQGVDVMAEFNNNPDVKQKVVNGEWDFYDVAESMKKPTKKPPAPMRSPNGASGAEKSTIASMTDEQFERFEKKVSGGARYKI